MADFKIFSDGACDMPRETADKNDISIIPFYVSLDGKSYQKEIDELSLDDFYSAVIDQRIFPKTSLPSVQDYINAFTPALENGFDILCFTITNTLSGSSQSAENARLILLETYPDAEIKILNSWQATGSQLLLVLQAAQMKRDGLSIAEIYDACEKIKTDTGIVFMVGALDYLRHGGRIGKLAAISAGLLNIKPLIVLKGGEISSGGLSRSRKKGLLKLVDLLTENIGDNCGDYIFRIGSTNTPEETAALCRDIKARLGSISIESDFRIGATIASHTGPDTIGICYSRKYTSL